MDNLEVETIKKFSKLASIPSKTLLLSTKNIIIFLPLVIRPCLTWNYLRKKELLSKKIMMDEDKIYPKIRVE